MKGVVFDSPSVIEGAKQQIAAAGLASRCEVIGGDFFATVPAGGDAYILSVVIHDWDDERAVAILKNCRKVMANTATLLLAESHDSSEQSARLQQGGGRLHDDHWRKGTH